MLTASKIAYRHGEKTALEEFGLTKEAFPALVPLAMQGLRAAGTWAAKKALPMLARGAKSLVQQLPGAAAQTGTMMAAEKLTQPAAGPSFAPMPGMMDQAHLPGMVR